MEVVTQRGPHRRLFDRMASGPDSARHYYARLGAVDTAFDGETGMDTGGVIDLYGLTVVGANRGMGNAYMATVPEDFAEALGALDIPMEGASFVDLGSGKGRALLLAARYPFARIIGVEFAEELHRAAMANAARLPGETRIELVQGDAAAYALPAGPLVVYLFNPFDRPLMQAVAQAALQSWRDDRRPFRVIYSNPVLAECWTEAGWSTAATGSHFRIFSPPAP